jgi:hypothetical protein
MKKGPYVCPRATSGQRRRGMRARRRSSCRKIWTGDSQRPWADAVAWKDDRIVAVGSDAEVRPRIDAATIVGGRVVYEAAP